MWHSKYATISVKAARNHQDIVGKSKFRPPPVVIIFVDIVIDILRNSYLRTFLLKSSSGVGSKWVLSERSEEVTSISLFD
jgi:hypothetical protein